MVPEALPYDADPISQIRFPETPAHLHEHTKFHVLRLHELPSLQANTVRLRISERQAKPKGALREANLSCRKVHRVSGSSHPWLPTHSIALRRTNPPNACGGYLPPSSTLRTPHARGGKPPPPLSVA